MIEILRLQRHRRQPEEPLVYLLKIDTDIQSIMLINIRPHRLKPSKQFIINRQTAANGNCLPFCKGRIYFSTTIPSFLKVSNLDRIGDWPIGQSSAGLDWIDFL